MMAWLRCTQALQRQGQRGPHWMDLTMLRLRAVRSSKVLSSVILPNSERMVVCASCTTAAVAFSTP